MNSAAVSPARRANTAFISHTRVQHAVNLFMIDDVPQNEVGQLRHERPEPGVLLQQ
jgi:hypothetical protein